MTELPKKVDIREVSLRDGLQIEKPISTAAKLELLEAVVATGVREVEATAFVSPSKVAALADALELAAELARFDNVEFSALVASANGAKRAIAAGLRSIEYVVSAADGHSRANVGRSTAEATAQIDDIVAIAHDSDATVEVIIATAWDCPFDGPTPPQRVLDIVEHQPGYGRYPGALGAQGSWAAQRLAGRVVDRRQLPAGPHDGPVRHGCTEVTVVRGADHR